jgi:NAD(P)-dependent dehydrogenase (short-subunit alcohol dehydrogenase family)
MQVAGKVVVVTGGANGIGRALSRRFASEGAKAIVVADLNQGQALEVAQGIKGIAVETDVGRESDVLRLVQKVLDRFGVIDLFCSNAGVGCDGGPDAPDADWDSSWRVNVMAHVYAARALLPGMLARHDGYFLQTVSAAGLLSQIGSAPYSVSKHAALAFAEWLSITYGDQGIKVSSLCPMGVRTNMLWKAQFGGGSFLLDSALEPDQVADYVIKGLADEKFLILPHAEVAEYFQRKASDYDRWLRGMRRLQASNPLLKEVVQRRDHSGAPVKEKPL